MTASSCLTIVKIIAFHWLISKSDATKRGARNEPGSCHVLGAWILHHRPVAPSMPLKKVRSEEKVEAVQWKHPSSKPVILSLLKGSRFNGKSYYLPTLSISILPDCKHVVFNTTKSSCTQLKIKVIFYGIQIGLKKWHKRFDLPEVELPDCFKR
ncbi:hypothetical protein SUGI_0714480 [Cryptomeria japonica]|nr:hypothetical protein SUGI_0714480 [Cryptomeria japonica]